MATPPKPGGMRPKASLPPTSWRMLGMGLELGLLIGGLTYLGYLGDERWGTTPWLALSGALLSTVGGTYNISKEFLKQPGPGKKSKKIPGAKNPTANPPTDPAP